MLKTMGITIIEGKDMQNEGDVLVNEEVVRLMKMDRWGSRQNG